MDTISKSNHNKDRKDVLKNLKKYIKLNLEDKIYGTIKNSNISILSKRDLVSIVNFMKSKNKYSYNMLKYTYKKMIYIYDFDLIRFRSSQAKERDSMLFKLCDNEQIKAMRYLLIYEIRMLYPFIDPCAEDNYLIRYASQMGKKEIVKLLLEDKKVRKFYRCIDPCAKNNYAIRHASKNGHLEVVKYLLSDKMRSLYPKAHIDPSAGINYAILMASKNGHLEVVKFLLSDEIRELYPKAYIDPSAENNIAIRHASQGGYTEVVKYLLSDKIRTLYPKIDPSADHNFALRYAVICDRIQVVPILLEEKKVIDYGIDGAINLCRIYGRKEMLEILIYYQSSKYNFYAKLDNETDKKEK